MVNGFTLLVHQVQRLSHLILIINQTRIYFHCFKLEQTLNGELFTESSVAWNLLNDYHKKKDLYCWDGLTTFNATKRAIKRLPLEHNILLRNNHYRGTSRDRKKKKKIILLLSWESREENLHNSMYFCQIKFGICKYRGAYPLSQVPRVPVPLRCIVTIHSRMTQGLFL